MRFSYDLKINNKSASLVMEAPSMESIVSNYGLGGPDKEVKKLEGKVDWNTSVSEILNRIQQMHFCSVVSSSETGSPAAQESADDDVLSSEESPKEEEGDNSYVQGFRYSWSLDNQQDGNAVETSPSSEEDDSEEKVGD